MKTEEELELDAAVARVMESGARKKLIVAGPGAGKTTLFQKLIEAAPGGPGDRLVLTFINNLKEDLERSLGEIATVHTLHGYCQRLLRLHAELRDGMTADFKCYPELTSLIKKDWRWLTETEAPRFVDRMRSLSCSEAEEAFYLGRTAYYDALDFDDSVYRVARRLNDHPGLIPPHQLVLIDEFQDFNRMEAEIINLLGRDSPIVIAGDDDQALYSKLRRASWDHIRAHYVDGEFEVFALPFCMRCPEVIVGAVNDVLGRARAAHKLTGRIDKPFRFFRPVKGQDSDLYPQIDFVRTSVQSTRANYFGKYVEEIIRGIPEEDFASAAAKFEPCVLVIGSPPYLPQVRDHLVTAGLADPRSKERRDERSEGLLLIHADPDSNLGWRVLLDFEDQTLAKAWVREAAEREVPLVDVIPADRKAALLAEAAVLAARLAEEPIEDEEEVAVPRVAFTSYEGSKGRAAQYVVLVGLHDGDLPRRRDAITDIEICKFLVGLTRTKKKCTILTTARFGENVKGRSAFLDWVAPERLRSVTVNAAYWGR